MNEFIAIQDIKAVLSKKRRIPSIVLWNRLEGRPRTNDFDRALKAEIRDALWMLTKQWQMGEFQGDDAGSAVFAKVHMETTRLNKYKPGEHAVEGFENDVPLETKVEQNAIPFTAGPLKISLDLRLLMGRQWLKLTGTPALSALRAGFIQQYPIPQPDPEARKDAPICAHPETRQTYAAVAGRYMDGAELYFYLKGEAARHAYDGMSLTPAQKTLIDEIAPRFIAWFEKLFYQPGQENKDAWISSQLEYRFACSAPKKGAEQIFTAEQYYHGHLDWYNLNIDRSADSLGEVEAQEQTQLEERLTFSFFPTPVQFDGMPNTRWWAFEEGRTNFGDIKPDTTDLNKLLLIEFGLVYANDWFMLPFTLPAGSVALVRGLSLTNVFGEHLWIEPAGSGSDEDWQRWNMYSLNIEGRDDLPADLSLVLLPSVPKIQESPPVEEVFLIRDEMANMVWGIEQRVRLPDGTLKPGREAALELANHLGRIVEAEGAGQPEDAQAAAKAPIRYRIMSGVPENWIPFIPVHQPGSTREIQLQRAAMPRIIDGDTQDPEKIRPRTQLLRQGLDQSEPRAYFLYEEEVPRAGTRIYKSFQRTRWYGGRVFNWWGIHKQTGRGEGSSGLAFDRLVPTRKRKKFLGQ